MYDEEFTEKMELDRAIKQICISSGSKSIGSENMSREGKSAKTVSTVISCRSVKTSVHAQREKIPLAKLKLEHLKRKQEIDLKLTELSYARNLMEAEMEVQEAHVSFRFLERETLSSIGDTECDGQRELKVLGQIRSKGNVHYQADGKQKIHEHPSGLPITLPTASDDVSRLPIEIKNEQFEQRSNKDDTLPSSRRKAMVF